MSPSSAHPVPLPSTRLDRVRAVGEVFDRTFEVDLAESDLHVLNEQLHARLDHTDALRDKLAEIKKEFASKIEANDATVRDLRRKIRSKKDRRTIQVQQWLTKSNEIVTVALASDTVIGEPRTATAAELQEPLPFGSPADDDAGDDEDPGFAAPTSADLAALPPL